MISSKEEMLQKYMMDGTVHVLKDGTASSRHLFYIDGKSCNYFTWQGVTRTVVYEISFCPSCIFASHPEKSRNGEIFLKVSEYVLEKKGH